MAKKRRVKAQKAIVQHNSEEDRLFNFVLGIFYFFVLEAVFMIGGLYLQNVMGVGGATGIPSVLGLIVWSILACTKNGKKEIYLGGIAISVLVPVILIIITLTGFVKFLPIMYASIVAFIVLEFITAYWLMKKK